MNKRGINATILKNEIAFLKELSWFIKKFGFLSYVIAKCENIPSKLIFPKFESMPINSGISLILIPNLFIPVFILRWNFALFPFCAALSDSFSCP